MRLGSLVVAISPNFAVLLIGRAMQGLGAGGIFPVASAVIGDTFPPEKRGGALGLIGAVFGLAFLIGPILGGILLGLFGWRSLFLVNLPIALIVIVLALATLPSTRPAAPRPFDWIGMTVLGVLLASLAFGINQLDTTNFGASLVSPNVWAPLLLTIILIPVFVAAERRARPTRCCACRSWVLVKQSWPPGCRPGRAWARQAWSSCRSWPSRRSD